MTYIRASNSRAGVPIPLHGDDTRAIDKRVDRTTQ
jgi:hypothetical protein